MDELHYTNTFSPARMKRARQAAERGALALDEAYGGDWPHDVDVDDLDMNSSECCLLACLSENYQAGAWKIFEKSYCRDHEWLMRHGFHEDDDQGYYNAAELTRAWRQLIEDRLREHRRFHQGPSMTKNERKLHAFLVRKGKSPGEILSASTPLHEFSA